jgi:membrane associated rhomboid family serine protease
MAPVYISILGIIVWLVFILFYALYWSSGFSLFQNVIVTVVSLAIAGLLIGLMWMVWYHPSGELRTGRIQSFDR